MRYKTKQFAILITIFFSVSAINFGFVFSTLTSNSHTQQIKLINDLKTSTVYNSNVVIDDTNPVIDWATAKAAGICTGSGTEVDPYIIRDHVFNGFLNIKHSRKHFSVLNCEFTDTVYGMWILNVSNGLIEDNHVSNALFGFDIMNCSHIEFRNNNCSLLGNTGILAQTSNDLSFYSNILSNKLIDGIRLNILENCIFEGNTADDNGNSGIKLDNIEDTLIYKNSVAYNGANGIELTNSDNITIVDNEAFNNIVNGIRVFSSDNNRLESNNFHHNGGDGLRVLSGSQLNVLKGNMASFNNLSGIAFYVNSDDNLIYDNTASNNEQHGFYISDSDTNLITMNSANDNTLNGFQLFLSNRNSITSNTANNNVNGTNLISSDDNIILGNNLANNIYCYNETNSAGNVYEENICQTPAAPGVPFDPFILGLILGLVIGFGSLAAVLILNSLRGRKE